jgi:hypothetical protein
MPEAPEPPRPRLSARQACLKGRLCDHAGLERVTDPLQRNSGRAGDLGRLHGDQPLEHRRVVMVKRKIDRGVAGRHQVAHHLQRKRGLAQALTSAQQDQLARAEPAGQRLVQHGETRQPDLGSGRLTRLQPDVGLVQNAVHRLKPLNAHGRLQHAGRAPGKVCDAFDSGAPERPGCFRVSDRRAMAEWGPRWCPPERPDGDVRWPKAPPAQRDWPAPL